MRRMAQWSLVMILAVSVMLAGCGAKDAGGDASSSTGTDAKQDVKTVKIFQFKVEIAEALNRLKGNSRRSTRTSSDIQTVGGGADYGAALKAKFAGNDAPDIFNNGGFQELTTWFEHLEDLSDQPWVKDVLPLAKEPMTQDGKLYGMPMNLEGTASSTIRICSPRRELPKCRRRWLSWRMPRRSCRQPGLRHLPTAIRNGGFSEFIT